MNKISLEDESFEIFSEICEVDNNHDNSENHEYSKFMNCLEEISIDPNKSNFFLKALYHKRIN